MAHIPDPIKSWNVLLSEISNKNLISLHVSALAKVIDFKGNKADVQLLTSESEQHPVIYNCYLLDSVENLTAGEMVLIVFTDLPLEDFQENNRTYQTNLKRRHSLNDAVIVGRLK